MLAAFDHQIGWCARLGSPFSAALLRRLKDDLAAGGPTASLLPRWVGDPIADAVMIRLLGALHALVLGKDEPELARLFPPNGPATPDVSRETVLDVLDRRRAFVGRFLRLPPKTKVSAVPRSCSAASSRSRPSPGCRRGLRRRRPAGRSCCTIRSWAISLPPSQAMLRDAIAGAGDRATAQAPFARLRFKPPLDGGTMELRLTLWPGGQSRLLATAHPHGRDIAWLP